MEKNRWVRGLIEGIAALAFGIFILFSPDNATNLIGLAAAGFLLVAGVVEAIARRERYTDTGFIRGIIGLVGGVIMLFLVWGDFVSITTAFNIFAAFLIAYGGVGLFNDFFSRGGKAFEWGPVLLDLILLAWGVLIFFSRTVQPAPDQRMDAGRHWCGHRRLGPLRQASAVRPSSPERESVRVKS